MLRGENGFNWRGGDVSRLESLSDIVYGFALTLLVVSLEVPSQYSDLQAAIGQIPAFAASFIVLVMFWYSNFMFHRRYGLEDNETLVYTVVQLFIVLFYVYPLKFLSVWLSDLYVLNREPTVAIKGDDLPDLMMMYGIGWTGIYGIFILLYKKAYSKRDSLNLSPSEILITRGNIRAHSISSLIGVISILLAVVAKFTHPGISILSGIAYSLMGPLHFWSGSKLNKQLSQVTDASEASPESVEPEQPESTNSD